MGGTYSNPDCVKCKYNHPFTSRTFTENTVAPKCKINDKDPPAKQVVEFTLDTGVKTKYIHMRAKPENGDISVETPSNGWIDDIRVFPGSKKKENFEIKESGVLTDSSEKLIIQIYYSDNKLSASNPDREIPNKADTWGNLRPELDLS